MPGSTPTYGLPYQTVGDPPNGPILGQDLAEAVEGELVRLDSAMVGFEAPAGTPAQTVPASTIIGLNWNPATSNVGGFGKPNTIDWTVPTAGVYVATVQGLVANGQLGRAYVDVIMGGRSYRGAFGGAGESGWGAAGIRRLTAGAVVKVELYCGTATTVASATFAVYRIGS